MGLQQKIRTYKKQIEEAEEIAALNLAKFRKAQQELEETEERSKLAEGQMSLARTVPETPWGTSKPDKNNVIRRSEHTQQMKKQKKVLVFTADDPPSGLPVSLLGGPFISCVLPGCKYIPNC